LDEVSELSSYLNAAWFNITGDSGEPIFHVEVGMKNGSRVLEISKVYSPGHSEILAVVAPPVASMSAEVLEVVLGEDDPSAIIQTCGRGSYVVMKDCQKAFVITGDAATLQLSAVSARTGRPAAVIERKGADYSGAEYLDLVVQPGWTSASIFILACVLAVVTLRSWPTPDPETSQPGRSDNALDRSTNPVPQRGGHGSHFKSAILYSADHGPGVCSSYDLESTMLAST
jgi:hypothetical protein